MLILLQNKDRPKFHINKVSSGYISCNVQICVDYGRDISLLYNGSGALSQAVKQSRCEVDHSSPPTAEVKNSGIHLHFLWSG
jgi:hypothetical protein